MQRLFSLYSILLLTCGIFVSSTFVSCKKNSETLSAEILPEEMRLQSILCDTLSIEAFTCAIEPRTTFAISTVTLGSFNDPLFGYANASILLQMDIRDTASIKDYSAYTTDSLVLYIERDTFYGDANASMNLHVKQLNTYIEPDDEKATSAFDPSGYLYPDDVNETSNWKAGSTSSRIRLKQSLGNYLLSINDSTLKSRTGLVRDSIIGFRGLYISCEPTSSKGAMAIVVLSSVKMYLYCHNESESTVITFSHTHLAADPIRLTSINKIEKNYLFTTPGDHAATGIADSIMYLQGLDGLVGKISFPYLSNFKQNLDTRKIAIQYAELLFKVDTIRQLQTLYPLPGMVSMVFEYNGEKIFYSDAVEITNNGVLLNNEIRIGLTKTMQNYFLNRNDLDISSIYLVCQRSENDIYQYFTPMGLVLKKPVLKIYYNIIK